MPMPITTVGMLRKLRGTMTGRSPTMIVPSNSIRNTLTRTTIVATLRKRRAILTAPSLISPARSSSLRKTHAFITPARGGKFSRGDFDGAIADLDRVIELNGKEPVPYTVRGDLYAKKNQYSAAIKDVQKAIKLDPKNGNNYLSLARYQLFNRKPR